MLGSKEQRTEGIKRQAQELIDQAYERGFNAGKEAFIKAKVANGAYEHGFRVGYDKCAIDKKDAREETESEAYQRGLDDAWECARKICSDEGLPLDEINTVFRHRHVGAIFTTYSASEAIEKLRQYEEQKKAESKVVNVGDEVVFDGGKGVVIDEISDDEVYILNDLGCVEKMERRLIVKTGRLCLSIERIIKQLQEDKE